MPGSGYIGYASRMANEKGFKERVEAFLTAVAEGVPKSAAAKAAGFKTPQRDAYYLLMQPQSIAFIADRVVQRIRSEVMPEALALAIELMRSKEVSARVRWDIARTFLAYGAGVVAPKPKGDDGAEVDPSEMTPAQLHAFIAAAETELANRATPIEQVQHIDSWI